MWWIFALLSALFAALTAIFAKIGIRNVDTDVATAVRTVIVAIITWGIVSTGGKISLVSTLNRQNLTFLILSGLTTGLSWIFYFKALQIGQVVRVASIDKLSVALAIIFAVVFLGEQLTWKIALGALLIISGTIVLIME